MYILYIYLCNQNSRQKGIYYVYTIYIPLQPKFATKRYILCIYYLYTFATKIRDKKVYTIYILFIYIVYTFGWF